MKNLYLYTIIGVVVLNIGMGIGSGNIVFSIGLSGLILFSFVGGAIQGMNWEEREESNEIK